MQRVPNDIPLIFLHWGDSRYLPWTLELAKGFNPEKRVILLGDERNEKYTSLGIEHHHFLDYGSDELSEKFERVFQYIAGPQAFGSEKWLKFNFRRWFFAYNFLCKHDLDAYWTFDSDTLIFTNLSDHESRFLAFDCTEQCNGSCMSGLVSSRRVLAGYLESINELFERPSFLEEWRQYVVTEPFHSYTEMSAYEVYRRERGVRSVRLNAIVDQTTFDDCVSLPHDMETYEHFQGTLKKLYFAPDGRIYGRHLPSDSYVRFLLLNMSWVPEFIFRRVYEQARSQLARPEEALEPSSLRVMPIEEDRRDRMERWRSKIHSALARARTSIGRKGS